MPWIDEYGDVRGFDPLSAADPWSNHASPANFAPARPRVPVRPVRHRHEPLVILAGLFAFVLLILFVIGSIVAPTRHTHPVGIAPIPAPESTVRLHHSAEPAQEPAPPAAAVSDSGSAVAPEPDPVATPENYLQSLEAEYRSSMAR